MALADGICRSSRASSPNRALRTACLRIVLVPNSFEKKRVIVRPMPFSRLEVWFGAASLIAPKRYAERRDGADNGRAESSPRSAPTLYYRQWDACDRITDKY